MAYPIYNKGSYASRSDRIKRSQAYADLLLKQGLNPVGDMITKGTGNMPDINMGYNWSEGLGNALQAGMGSYQGSQAGNEQSEMDAQAQREAQDAVTNFPKLVKSRMVDKLVPGEITPDIAPPPEPVANSPYGSTESPSVTSGVMALPKAAAQFKQAPDTTTQVEEKYDVPVEEYANDLGEFSAGLDPTNPYLAGIRETALSKTLEMPEKILQIREKAEEAKALLTQQQVLAREKLQQDHEIKMRQATTDEQRAQEVKDHNQALELLMQSGQENLRVIAGMNIAGRAGAAAEKAADKEDIANAKKADQAEATRSTLNNIESSLSGLTDKDGNITPALSAYIGPRNAYIPEWLNKSETNEAGNKLEALQQQLTMLNLAEAKKGVGQSFGSMQVQEWDKFMNQLGNIKRGATDKTMKESLAYVNNFVKNKRDVLEAAINAGMHGAERRAPAAADDPLGLRK